MSGPLEGLRVLDLGTRIAAPFCAGLLGELGADVIKVEQPGDGDPHRTNINLTNFPKAAVNYPWHMDARNKRSIALDLKSDPGRAALDRLIARCDVLIINFPFPVRSRLRLNYDDVRRVNPRAIYASFSGYGETGRTRTRSASTPTPISRAAVCSTARATRASRQRSRCPDRATGRRPWVFSRRS